MHIFKALPVDHDEIQVLNLLLAKFADHCHAKGASSSTFDSTISAVRHYCRASNMQLPMAITQLSKAYRKLHPVNARTSFIPDMHKILSHIQPNATATSEVALRNHLVALLLILGTKRPSDVAHIYRHERTLRFTVQHLDVPPWARTYTSTAAQLLHDLGLIERMPTETEFIIMSIRAYIPKTSSQTQRLFGNWVPLHENRFLPSLCPVLATAKYLQATNSCKISTTLRYGKSVSISGVLDDKGINELKIHPLLISLSGKPRFGLQANTISRIIRTTILQELNLSSRDSVIPYVLRSMSATYKIAYGVPIERVMVIGDWRSSDTFAKFYQRSITPPIAAIRLSDNNFHDWKLTRAHDLFTNRDSLCSLALLDAPTPSTDTQNDAAIARSLQASSQNKRSRRLRRNGSSY